MDLRISLRKPRPCGLPARARRVLRLRTRAASNENTFCVSPEDVAIVPVAKRSGMLRLYKALFLIMFIVVFILVTEQ